ncbi:unnamed protein product, partial [marine sediment metagenome]
MARRLPSQHIPGEYHHEQDYHNGENTPPKNNRFIPGTAKVIEDVHFFPFNNQLAGHPVRGWRRGNQGNGNTDNYTECPGDDRLVAEWLDPGRVRRNQLHVDLKPDTEEESKEHRDSGAWAIDPSPDDTKQENGGKRRGKKGIKCLYIDEETPPKPAYHPPEADGNYENN